RIGDDAKMRGERERAVSSTDQNVRERLTLEVLHHDDGNALVLGDLVGLHDVRMVEARSETSFVQEHVPELGIVREIFLQRLEDDELVEAARTARDGEINDRRAALTELHQNSVL